MLAAFVPALPLFTQPHFSVPEAAVTNEEIALRWVHMELTATYGWQVRSPDRGVTLRSPNFWKDFRVRLVQDKKVIRPLAQRGEPAYSIASAGTSSVLIGADVELEYDPEDVQSAPVTVVVKTPEGQKIKATFDLAKLR
jgi:hypothetical protein